MTKSLLPSHMRRLLPSCIYIRRIRLWGLMLPYQSSNSSFGFAWVGRVWKLGFLCPPNEEKQENKCHPCEYDASSPVTKVGTVLKFLKYVGKYCYSLGTGQVLPPLMPSICSEAAAKGVPFVKWRHQIEFSPRTYRVQSEWRSQLRSFDPEQHIVDCNECRFHSNLSTARTFKKQTLDWCRFLFFSFLLVGGLLEGMQKCCL